MSARMMAMGRLATARVGSARLAAHARAFSDKVSVGVVGYGGIGRELIDQVGGFIKKGKGNFQFRGIADVDGMVLNNAGMSLENSAWTSKMGELCSKTPMIEADLDAFAAAIKKDCDHAVIADCTAAPFIAKQYAKWLSMGINVVTPNKKAQTDTMSYYKEMKAAAAANSVQFNYEASVGAALPVICTIKDFNRTGDGIVKVEGVFSGTLSYIFNVMSATGAKFSDCVADAAKNGFTEPDPRDDLSGTDVQRKCVIVARECGLNIELSDVPVESLVPEPLRDWTPPAGVKLADAFVEALKPYDGGMEEKLKAAGSGVLRYVGTVDVKAGKASVALKTFGSDSAFAGLKHADNIVLFDTERYTPQPLVCQGPGAGIPVTAGGVFADLLKQVPPTWIQ
jgi:aspartokinase/homoserine dehydrogenase 1